MHPIKIDEIQPLLLNILRQFDKYCRKNGIQYYAAGGTLLGAIRHKGFIPWDDDIDLFVTDDAAEKLCRLAQTDPYIDDEKRYKILLPAKAPNVYPIIKLVDTKTITYERNIDKKYATGIWIDIFKMVYWPQKLEESEKLFKKQNSIKRRLQIVICGNLKKRKYKIIYPFIAPIKFALLAMGKDCDYWSQKLYDLGSKNDSGFWGNLAWASSMKDRYPVEWYAESEEKPFEDMLIPVPKEYDKILTQFYKDYMQLPPEEKRVRHNYEAYYVE